MESSGFRHSVRGVDKGVASVACEQCGRAPDGDTHLQVYAQMVDFVSSCVVKGECRHCRSSTTWRKTTGA